jgi:hypothetical protein
LVECHSIHDSFGAPDSPFAERERTGFD